MSIVPMLGRMTSTVPLKRRAATRYPTEQFSTQQFERHRTALSYLEIGQRGRICTRGRSVPSRACCCYTTRCCPDRCFRQAVGVLVLGNGEHFVPWNGSQLKMAFPMGLARHSSNRQRVALRSTMEAGRICLSCGAGKTFTDSRLARKVRL